MALALFFAAAGFALVALAIASHIHYRRALSRPDIPAARPLHYPSLTVIRPVRGYDTEADENFAAMLDTGYPGEVDTIFVFDHDGDPGLPAARAAIASHARRKRPGRATLLFCGAPPPGRTGKLHAMIAALPHARGELLAFGDSDTRPDRTVLSATVGALLATPRAGCAFAPVFVAGSPRTASDVGYALLINALYGPAVADVAAHADVPFIMGQLMVFRREALEAIGGVQCAEGQLVDDMHIGAEMHSKGYRNVMGPHALPIVTSGLSFAEFVDITRRWMLFSRTGIPSSFARPLWWRGAEYWLALLLSLAAMAAHHPVAALPPLLAVGALCVSLLSLSRRIGGDRIPLRLAWFSALLFVVVPIIYFAAHWRREVNWRGRAYALNAEHRLATQPSP